MWSKNYNLDLSFRVAWGMEVGCAKGVLSPKRGETVGTDEK